MVDPGQTVDITAASATEVPRVSVDHQVRNAWRADTFAWTGGGSDPVVSPEKQTGKAVVTLDDVQDVTLSGLTIASYGTDDAVDVIGSSDISLVRLDLIHLATTTPTASADVMIDGASSNVTVARSLFESGTPLEEVLAKSGAQQVALTDNLLSRRHRDIGFHARRHHRRHRHQQHAAGRLHEQQCRAHLDHHGRRHLWQRREQRPRRAGERLCSLPPRSGFRSTLSSACRVHRRLQRVLRRGDGHRLLLGGHQLLRPGRLRRRHWSGDGRHHAGQRAESPVPPEGSPAINSGNCSAPGVPGTDFEGNPWVRDPLATDADLGNGSCYDSRGRVRAAGQPAVHVHRPAGGLGRVPGWRGAVQHRPDGHRKRHQPVGRAGQLHGQLRRREHGGPRHPRHRRIPHLPDAQGSTRSRSRPPTPAARPAPILCSRSTRCPTKGRRPGSAPRPWDWAPRRASIQTTADFTSSDGGVPAWEIGTSKIIYGAGQASVTVTPDGTWDYTYAEPGSYTATLTVTDKLGRTATAPAAVTVGDEPQNVYPTTDYDHSVPAHGLVKIPLANLEDDCCARGALVDVRVTDDSKGGFVIVYPDGATRPDLSTVQFQACGVAENSTLAIGGSTTDFYNGSAGSINLQVVTYGVDTIMDTYGGSVPRDLRPGYPGHRAAEDRAGWRLAGACFSGAGLHGVPANAEDVVLDVTASGGATSGSFATYGASGWGAAGATTVGYWAKGQQVTNLDMIPVSGGKAVLENQSAGTANFTAEVLGYYLSTGSDAVFLLAMPRRLGTGLIPANKSVTMPIAGKDGIPATGTTAVAVDLTASEATASGTLAAYLDGTALPFLISASDALGVSVADASIVGAVGKDGAIRLYNAGSGTVAVNVDLTGSYYAYP